MLWWTSGRPHLTSVIPWGWVDICPLTSLFGCSPLMCGVRGALHPADLPEAVEPGQSHLHHQLWQKSNEQEGCPHGNPVHQWGRLLSSGTLSTLVQQESPETAVVVTKIFINSPYFPQGSFGLPFLDVATLIVDSSTYWFLLSWLHLCWLLLYSPTEVILPKEKEGDRLRVIPFTKEVLWESSIEDHWLSSLVSLSVPATSSCDNKDESTQTAKNLTSEWPWGGCKQLLKLRPSSSGTCVVNRKSWLRNKRIGRPGCR